MRKKWYFIAPLAIVAMALFIALGGALVQQLWNWLLPSLFGLRQMHAKGVAQLHVFGRLDHLGQGLDQLILGAVQVFKLAHKQIVQGFQCCHALRAPGAPV